MSVCLGRGSYELMAPGLRGESPKDPSGHPRNFVGHLPPLPHSSLTPLSLLLLGPQSESWEGDCHPCEGLGGLWGRCWKEVGGSLQRQRYMTGSSGLKATALWDLKNRTGNRRHTCPNRAAGRV